MKILKDDMTQHKKSKMNPILAIDFDGTIAHNEFPGIGKPLPLAIEVIKELQEHYRTILWTCRTGESLDNAVQWCESHGLQFDAINENVSKDIDFAYPKVFANIYIDDRAFGGFPGWDVVREQLM